MTIDFVLAPARFGVRLKPILEKNMKKMGERC